jgi:hypothetical protein
MFLKIVSSSFSRLKFFTGIKLEDTHIVFFFLFKKFQVTAVAKIYLLFFSFSFYRELTAWGVHTAIATLLFVVIAYHLLPPLVPYPAPNQYGVE